MSCGCVSPELGPPLDNICYGGTYLVFMSLINALLRKKCDIGEACQRITPKAVPDPEYDFIVIGGGAAGAAVAGRLSEVVNWKVLLIEAGFDEPLGSQIPAELPNFILNPAMDWGYQTEVQTSAFLGNGGRTLWPRAKVLGGCGVINGMMYTRGVPKDYDGWEAAGNTDWGYNSVLDNFKKSENNEQIGTLVNAEVHASGGPMTISQFPYHPPLAEDILVAAEEIGYSAVNDLNDVPFTGFSIAQTANLKGTRVSSARAFLRPARNRSNLHVMLNSTATKILLDTTSDSKKAVGVQFLHNKVTITVRASKEIIISGGAINSPQLLLLSGIGPKNELDKVGIEQLHNLPGVGQNLNAHVAFKLSFTINAEKSINPLDWVAVSDYFSKRAGPLSSTAMSQITGRLTSKYGDPTGDNPDIQFFFYGYDAFCSRTGSVGEFENPNNPDAPRSFSISAVNIKPKSRGYIGLLSDKPLDPPLIDPKYLTEEDDLNVLIEAVRVMQTLCNATVLREKYLVEPRQESYGNCDTDFDFDSDEYWGCAIRHSTGGENHHTSSCKMGPSSDPLAVVDPQLQVYGIEGLRVMDAAIMPSVVSGNTHATCVMIGEKGADYVKTKWLV